MSGRITQRFDQLRAAGKAGFIAYVTAGDPSPDALPGILSALDEAGTDVIELGIPFSDPLADGPTIQAASGRALEAGMTVARCLDAVRDFRKTSETPLVFFTYLNPVFSFGFERFAGETVAAGADGLLVLDLPPDEGGFAVPPGLDIIRLLAPTTPPSRVPRICESGSGFVYYVSREGVTGEQASLAEGLEGRIREIRAHTRLPIAVGFGISSPGQCAEVARVGDAAVVGSAIVKHIARAATEGNDLADAVRTFVGPLAQAAHDARSGGF
jgi:tryptophan synthase alpha chain